MSAPQQALFDAHADLAYRIGMNRARRAGLDALAVEEYGNCGLIGLLDACRRYDPGRKTAFKTYAYTRINGVIVDEMRNADCLTRLDRDRVKAGEREDVSAVSMDMCGPGCDRTYGSMFATPRRDDPARRLEARELLEKIVASIPKRHGLREAFELYHFRGWTMKAIGQWQAKSESRICQMMREAMEFARKYEVFL